VKRGRVVIVNDSTGTAQAMSRALKEAGLEVEVYKRGIDALEPLRANPPDVIPLDQTNFPMKGADLFAKLNEGAAPPVIFVTPHALDVQRTLGRRGTPAADYIECIIPTAELVRRVTNLID
jgi:DNA-binding response OmpR family regulator